MPLSGYRKPSTGIPVTDLAIGTWGKLITGNYYLVTGQRDTGSGLNNSGQLRLSPWVLSNPVTISRIGAEVTLSGDAGSKVRIGVYADDGNGYPGSLLLDAGTINGDSVTVQQITVPFGTTGIPTNAEVRTGYQITGVTGALPSTFTAGGASVGVSLVPRIFVKVA
jgi:hypothetical protein